MGRTQLFEPISDFVGLRDALESRCVTGQDARPQFRFQPFELSLRVAWLQRSQFLIGLPRRFVSFRSAGAISALGQSCYLGLALGERAP